MDMDPILAVIAIIFGILVIAIPAILGWIVGIFFILVGIWLLIDYMNKGQKKGAQDPAAAESARTFWTHGKEVKGFYVYY